MRGGIFAGVPRDGEYGSVTCAVAVRTSAGQDVYAMSCQHVFSPDLDGNDGRMQSGSRVSPVISSDPQTELRQVGTTLAYGGRVRIDGLPSFDVQLARVQDAAWLRRALSDVMLSPSRSFVTNRDSLELIAARRFFEILVPANHPDFIHAPRFSIAARYSTMRSETLSIEYIFYAPQRHIDVHHLRLIELQVLAPVTTQPGDSGSPVIVRNDDGSGTLVGMHIAGVEGTNLTYAIPAWQLFEPVNYWNLPDGATLRPVNP